MSRRLMQFWQINKIVPKYKTNPCPKIIKVWMDAKIFTLWRPRKQSPYESNQVIIPVGKSNKATLKINQEKGQQTLSTDCTNTTTWLHQKGLFSNGKGHWGRYQNNLSDPSNDHQTKKDTCVDLTVRDSNKAESLPASPCCMLCRTGWGSRSKRLRSWAPAQA